MTRTRRYRVTAESGEDGFVTTNTHMEIISASRWFWQGFVGQRLVELMTMLSPARIDEIGEDDAHNAGYPDNRNDSPPAVV